MIATLDTSIVNRIGGEMNLALAAMGGACVLAFIGVATFTFIKRWIGALFGASVGNDEPFLDKGWYNQQEWAMINADYDYQEATGFGDRFDN